MSDFNRKITHEMMEASRKSKKSLKRICKLVKDEVSEDQLRRSYGRYSVLFGILKAYMFVYLVGVDHTDEEVLRIREEMRDTMGVYIKVCRMFEYLYPGQDYTQQKPFKMMVKSYNKAQVKAWLALVDRGPEGLTHHEPC